MWAPHTSTKPHSENMSIEIIVTELLRTELSKCFLRELDYSPRKIFDILLNCVIWNHKRHHLETCMEFSNIMGWISFRWMMNGVDGGNSQLLVIERFLHSYIYSGEQGYAYYCCLLFRNDIDWNCSKQSWNKIFLMGIYINMIPSCKLSLVCGSAAYAGWLRKMK